MDVKKVFNLEAEMAQDAIVITYLQDEEIAKDFYRALCNMRWCKVNVLSDDERIMDKLRGEESNVWSCSWRHSGAIVADIRNKHYNTHEGYMDFYCSDKEGEVSELVEECFNRMGWEKYPWP